MIVQFLEKLDFDFDLEFNIVEFGEVEFFCWIFCWIFEYDSGDIGKGGI